MIPRNAKPFSRDGWIFEFKYDGYRALASKEQLLTRNKKDATAWYPKIVEALRKIRGRFVLDGEICLVDEHGIPDFEAMRGGADRKSGLTLNYYVFDLLFLDGKDLRHMPLVQRKDRLGRLIPKGHAHVSYVDHIATAGEPLYLYAVSIGMEGILGKRADSHYVGGITHDWLKVKAPNYSDGWKRRHATPQDS